MVLSNGELVMRNGKPSVMKAWVDGTYQDCVRQYHEATDAEAAKWVLVPVAQVDLGAAQHRSTPRAPTASPWSKVVKRLNDGEGVRDGRTNAASATVPTSGARDHTRGDAQANAPTGPWRKAVERMNLQHTKFDVVGQAASVLNNRRRPG